jgi:hypothetical protein
MGPSGRQGTIWLRGPAALGVGDLVALPQSGHAHHYGSSFHDCRHDLTMLAWNSMNSRGESRLHILSTIKMVGGRRGREVLESLKSHPCSVRKPGIVEVINARRQGRRLPIGQAGREEFCSWSRPSPLPPKGRCPARSDRLRGRAGRNPPPWSVQRKCLGGAERAFRPRRVVGFWCG